jgi:hypothetical protein
MTEQTCYTSYVFLTTCLQVINDEHLETSLHVMHKHMLLELTNNLIG